MNQTTEKALRYRAVGRTSSRAYVAKASGGRLGYVHMFDMSADALEQLHVDLDAENHARDGVVIDIRNNNGGFVNVYAIDVFARRGYFNMTARGLPRCSRAPLLGQRALELPTVLVTNQHSLSDAEDFTEGYRTLKLGKVVGEPTAGWIIYTGGVHADRRLDAAHAAARRSSRRDGTPMEMHPRPVDVRGDAAGRARAIAGKDTQLDTAVAELLKQIGAGEDARRASAMNHAVNRHGLSKERDRNRARRALPMTRQWMRPRVPRQRGRGGCDNVQQVAHAQVYAVQMRGQSRRIAFAAGPDDDCLHASSRCRRTPVRPCAALSGTAVAPPYGASAMESPRTKSPRVSKIAPRATKSPSQMQCSKDLLNRR